MHNFEGMPVEEAFNIYFVGTAGCGKSTLTAAFYEWLQTQDYDSVLVNLDPGADTLPYEPDIDIRDWVSLTEVMHEYSLGPNGAQVAAADLLALNAPKVKKVLDEFETDFFLFDTPGQIELFAFRESSRKIIECFGEELTALCFLIDPMLARNPNGLISSLMFAATTNFRLSLPMITFISKSDLLSEEDMNNISNWTSDSYALLNALSDSAVTAQNQISIEILKALETSGAYGEPGFVSSETMTGIEDIYNSAQELFAGGLDRDAR